MKTSVYMKKSAYEKWGDLLLAALALGVMLLTLLAGGELGLSDNGDFPRVLEANAIAYDESSRHSFTYIRSYWMELEGDTPLKNLTGILFRTEGLGEYPSIHHIFVRAAQAASYICKLAAGGDLHVFRTAFLGVLMSAAYALLLYALFRRIRLKTPLDIAFKLIIIAVLCDIGYTAYFNSFYSESVQILALMCVAVTGIDAMNKKETGPLGAALFMASLVFYGWSKFANIPVGIAGTALFAYPLVKKTRLGRKKYTAVISGAACLSLMLIYVLVPKWMDEQTNYNSVFFGILKDASPEQSEEYLEELGLPEYMAELKNSNYYMDEVYPIVSSESFKEDFSKLSKLRILGFYMKNPGYLMEKLDISIQNSGFIRPFYLSNYGEDAERAALSGRFSAWSELRKALPFNRSWANLALLAAAVLAAVWLIKERGGIKKSAEAGLLSLLLLFGAAALYSLIIPVVSNGEGDIAKHMFAYAQLVDYFILALLYLAARELGKREKRTMAYVLPAAVICAVFAGAVVTDSALAASRASAAHDRLEPGCFVYFGNIDGSPAKWVVSEMDENGAVTLIAADNVAQMSFSDEAPYGSNLWTRSSVRAWLNGGFMSGFTKDERTQMILTDNRYILSSADKELAESGSRPAFCWHVPGLSARGADEAYAAFSRDYVYLPDLDDLQRLINLGISHTRGGPYWLETPYYGNSSMVRAVFPDGYVYMRDANTVKGVVPVVRVRDFSPAGGSGSRRDPFFQ